jgi:NAD(P)-dependent dehydrogenase (short-subunit alcohol dehydrogenase family)
MTESGKTAFITGGASGIGKAVAQMLFSKGCNVFIADYNIQGASALVAELNKKNEQGISENKAEAGQLDVTDWNQQVQAFEKAITAFGRIDYVYPIAGIGEKAWIKNDLDAKGFEAPDLTCLDVDLKAVLYTCSLAIQHFRRQEPNNHGFRGKSKSPFAILLPNIRCLRTSSSPRAKCPETLTYFHFILLYSPDQKTQ